MRILITGGAGFIGSHLADFLIGRGHDVTVFDNLSRGTLTNLQRWQGSPHLRFIEADIRNREAVGTAVQGQELVFHFCDNGDIQFANAHSSDYVDQNILGAFHVLEAMRRWNVRRIAFPSSTTVLGDATVVPTPENYGPLQPMNLYGGGKLACEGLLSAYAHAFDIQSYIFRFVDIVGERIDHGVIFDFIRKLKVNSRELEILGDGFQQRSFMLVDDCIEAIWISQERLKGPVNLVHIGNLDQISITRVGQIVSEVMGVEGIPFKYTGGKKGWRGDAFTNFIANTTLERIGWKPRWNSEGAVREAVIRILDHGRNPK